MSKYKYLLFDIDDTLINFEKSFHNCAAKVLELGGWEVTGINVRRFKVLNDIVWFSSGLEDIYEPYIKENYHRLYHKYVEDSLDKAINEFGLKGNYDDLMTCFNHSLGEEAHVNENAVKVLNILKDKYTLAVATNGLTIIQPYKMTKLPKVFDKIFISEEMNCMKPYPEYFKYITGYFNCQPEECLMIGDSLVNDIGGAGNSGIDSCYYNPGYLKKKAEIQPVYEIHDFVELLDIV